MAVGGRLAGVVPVMTGVYDDSGVTENASLVKGNNGVSHVVI